MHAAERASKLPRKTGVYYDKNGIKKVYARRMPVKTAVGSACVSKLVSKAIGHVITLARARDRAREWNRENVERLAEYSKAYYAKHSKEIMEKITKRLRAEPAHKIMQSIRGRLSRVLSYSVSKTQKRHKHSTEEYVQCSAVHLAAHLGKSLQTSDLGKDLHVDHIFPLKKFDLSTIDGIQRANHWSNLQALPAKDNTSKNARLPTKAMAAKVDPKCWPDGVTMDMLPDVYPRWATSLRMDA